MMKLTIISGLLALLILSGCTKQKECSETIDTINATVARFDKLDVQVSMTDPKKAAEQMKDLAKAVEEESEKIGKLKPTTPELKKHVDAYQQMVDDMSKATTELSKAAKEMADLEASTKKAQKDLESALEAISKACAGGAPGCLEIGTKMQQAPSGGEADEVFLKKLEAFGQMMKGITPESPQVKGPLDLLVKAVEGQVALLKKVKKTEEAANKAAEDLDKATSAEDGLVDAINNFCGSI